MTNRYFTISNILLITIAVYFSISGFYKVATYRLDPVPPPSVAGDRQISSVKDEISHPLSYYQPIVKRNLFNTNKDAGSKPVSIKVETLKQTELKLKLWGTVSGLGGQTYAVIEEAKSRQQNLYKVGDAVQTATVKMVFREKVILSVNGKDEVLEIEEIRGSAGGRRPPQTPPRSRRQKITLKRSQIESSVKNVNELMKQVKIRPHTENGQAAGLMLSSIQRNSIFRRMGLRSGDVITGVNGSSLVSVDDALKIYENMKTSSNMSIEIKRRGRNRTIDYNIE
ncbi:MAG: type II secretion system protein N [Thermodesulfobacteriota bacterium]|nr:type II secretion system protein N [Thermodesulfobacteriota bacterium]